MTDRTPEVTDRPANRADSASWRGLDPQQKRAYLAQLMRQKTARDAVAHDAATLVPRPEQWHEPFPLTDVQQAYWLGQSDAFGLGNVATHMYSEVDVEQLDLDRFAVAMDRIIRHHPMLRAVILPDGAQRILSDVPDYRPRVVDLRGQPEPTVQNELARIRAELSHQVIPPDRWPMFDCVIAIRDPHIVRLHLSFSLLILDAWSIKLVLAQWALLYQFPALELPPFEITFRDVVLHQEARKATPAYERAKNYWSQRLADIPPAPDLPLVCDPNAVHQPRFARRATSLDAMRWSRIKDRAAANGLRPSAVLLAAFGDVLRAWSRSSRFTINLTLFNRPAIHPQIGDLVGDFTSLTLLAADCRQPESFLDRVRRLQDQLGQDLDHADFNGIEVLRELWRRFDRPPGTVMPIVFTSVVSKSSLADDVPLGEVVYGISQTPQVWLDHQIFERGGALTYNWDYVEQLFPEGLVDDMFDAYSLFLRRLSEEDDAWHQRVRRHLPEAQLRQRRAVNATVKPFPDVRLESLFFDAARKHPNSLAIAAADRTFTYAELADLVRHAAGQLRACGARPNSLVAVVMEKGWEQVVAVLAILHAGAAYLPIDPALPDERIGYLLSNGEVNLALTQPSYRNSPFWPDAVRRIAIEPEPVPSSPDEPPPPSSTDDLAYVIYTSGSTGQPKGVMITHRAAVNTILDMNDRFSVGPDDRVLSLSSLSFDLSVYDIFGLLAAGGAVVLPDPADSRNPDRWLELIDRHRVTLWNTVPSLMEMLVEATHGRQRDQHPLRKVFLSGDWIPVSLPERISHAFPNADVVSLGGATEAAIWSIYHPVAPHDRNAPSIPYGRPLANQSWHVLHDDGLPCPVWVPGELYIAGKGLALGYWKDPAKTDARFIRHPHTGERLYRTGDWGRYLPNGDIEFLGREDTQVKILGHRIELGEIEAALLEHDDLRAAVVCAVGDPRGHRRLLAFVVPKDPARRAELETSGDVPAFLAKKLPHYMVPGEIHWLEELPLTANGKVDRAALARKAEQLKSSTGDNLSHDAELDELARQVLAVISAEMSMPQLTATENLMHVGASSIDMIRLANRFEEEFGFRPNLPDFFRNPTVLGLAELLRDRRANPAGEPSQSSSPTSTLSVILDPAEREAFKQQQLGLRRFPNDAPVAPLPELPLDEERRVAFGARRSRRQFLREPIPAADLSTLLGGLQQLNLDGHPKYRYGSAGGLYPVQTYLHLKHGAVAGFDAGVFYYDPVRHALVSVAPGIEIDREIHQTHINQPTFDQCGFSIFLIGAPAAIEPLYGELSRHFITLEAGAMTQVLEEIAARMQIGLCQIGWINFDRIRPLFGLDESQFLVHSLVGGRIAPDLVFPSLTLPVPEKIDVEYQEGEL